MKRVFFAFCVIVLIVIQIAYNNNRSVFDKDYSNKLKTDSVQRVRS